MEATPPLVPLFRAENLSVSFGEKSIFSGVNFSIYPGDHLAIIGKNGSGKSTLLKIISAELRPPHSTESPSIFWGFSGALSPSALDPKTYIRVVSPAQQANYIRQGWSETGRGVVLSGLSNTPLLYDVPSEQEVEIVERLATSAGLSALLDREIASMSQGQLRAILLMRALIGNPLLLLLDEPFDGLDTTTKQSITKLMHFAADTGTTLLITSHRAEDIPPFIKNIYTPTQTELTPVASMHPLDAIEPPQFLCNPIDIDVATSNDVFLTLLTKQTTRASALLPQNGDIFRLTDVDVFVDRQKILENIQWVVKKNEHWVISGKNGSGKSTLLRLLYGEEFVAFGGNICWFGKGRVTLDVLHSYIGYVSDSLHYRYEYDLTSEQVVLSGISGTIGLYSEPADEDRFMAKQWMEKLDLLSLADTPYDRLSTGQARRILLARALAGAPPILLLDEPFSGLDPESRAKFFQLLPLLAKSGIQLIMVSHYTDDYRNVFTHKLALEKGRVTSIEEL